MRSVQTNVRVVFHQPREHPATRGDGEHLHFEVSQTLSRTREPLAQNPDVDESIEDLVRSMQEFSPLPVEGTIEVLLTSEERRLVAVVNFYRGSARDEIEALLEAITRSLQALEANGVELLDLRLDQTLTVLELVDTVSA